VEYLRINRIVPPGSRGKPDWAIPGRFSIGCARLTHKGCFRPFALIRFGRAEPFWLGLKKVSFLSRKAGEPNACILTA
jgi:hypothetical protein